MTAGDSHRPVRLRRNGEVATLVLDHPPVNALGAVLRSAIWAAMDLVQKDPEVAAVVLAPGGDTFSAGADITEFGRADLPPAPDLPALCDQVESCPKPVVAALRGAVLGGGLELALAAHYRLADATARLGFPEIKLGLLPGAGGTQRAPRLTGASPALEMMLRGTPIPASQAEKFGLIDGVTGGDVVAAAEVLARELAQAGTGPRPTRDCRSGLDNPAAYERAVADAKAEAAIAQTPAPARIVEAVEAALLLPFEAGCALEAAAFADLMHSEASHGLRHMFSAERAARAPARSMRLAQRRVHKIALLGDEALTIAVPALRAGIAVTVIEPVPQVLSATLAMIGSDAAPPLSADALARLSGAATGDAVAQADVVIAPADADLGRIGAALGPEASLMLTGFETGLDAAAGATGRIADTLGISLSRGLAELAPCSATGAAALGTGFALVERVGLRSVLCGAAGALGRQVIGAGRQAALFLLEDGAEIAAIDAAWRGFGFAQGVFETMDAEGLERGWQVRQIQATTRDPTERYVTIADRLCEAGRTGRVSGRGFYAYSGGQTDPVTDPVAAQIVEAARDDAGTVARTVAEAEVVETCLLAMVLEGLRLQQAGEALCPGDIDVAMVAGHGFPRWRGGPMQWADFQGLALVETLLQRRAREEDARFWAPPSLLRDLVKNGRSFATLNAEARAANRAG